VERGLQRAIQRAIQRGIERGIESINRQDRNCKITQIINTTKTIYTHSINQLLSKMIQTYTLVTVMFILVMITTTGAQNATNMTCSFSKTLYLSTEYWSNSWQWQQLLNSLLVKTVYLSYRYSLSHHYRPFKKSDKNKWTETLFKWIICHLIIIYIVECRIFTWKNEKTE
jgi:Na+/alanine symporter